MHRISKTWNEARADCLSKGGDLASFSSLEQYVRVVPFFGTHWIGYNDISVEGTWEWSDQDSSTWTNWKAGEPNNLFGVENCAFVDQNGFWYDMPCGEKMFYVCKGESKFIKKL